MRKFILSTVIGVAGIGITLAWPTFAHQTDGGFWMKLRASDKHTRTTIAEIGVAIITHDKEYVYAIGTHDEYAQLQKLGWIDESYFAEDFPSQDANFHNYNELKVALEDLARRYPDVMRLDSLGRSHEGREIFHATLSADFLTTQQKPAVVFMGGHHAREHLSVELPLKLIEHLCRSFEAGDLRIRNLLGSREIHIIPMVNPDGAEYDIADNNYKYWRKNRRRNDGGSYGVDLNRNYGYRWGTGGASPSPNSDTYRGTQAFSEPESQAIKAFVERQQNLTILLSFHTFSELILYPWGHTYDPITNSRDLQVYETMARRMAQWNGYTPQQSSDLYITSGDTTDWSYGEHGIFSFTFELDPKNNGWGGGGFYPGQDKIPTVFEKNLEPALYLIDLADNPYRVLQPVHEQYGLQSALVD